MIETVNYCKCCNHNPCECQDEMAWGHYIDYRHSRCGAFRDIPKIDGTVRGINFELWEKEMRNK